MFNSSQNLAFIAKKLTCKKLHITITNAFDAAFVSCFYVGGALCGCRYAGLFLCPVIMLFTKWVGSMSHLCWEIHDFVASYGTPERQLKSQVSQVFYTNEKPNIYHRTKKMCFISVQHEWSKNPPKHQWFSINFSVVILTQSVLCVLGALYMQQSRSADIISCSALKFKLEKMIEHQVNRQRLWGSKETDKTKSAPNFFFYFNLFFGMVFWKNLSWGVWVKTVKLQKTNFMCMTETPEIMWGEKHCFEQPDSWLLHVEVCGRQTAFLLSAPCATEQRLSGTF